MDMMTGLRYFSDHIEHVIGGLVVLFLLTSILLLIRNINNRDGQKGHAAGDSDRTSADSLDVGAVEAAMMRVLAAQGVGALVAAGAKATGSESAKAPTSSEGASGDPAQLSQAIQEKDSKLQELAREIDRLNAEVAVQKSAPGSEGGAGGDGKVSELQAKIEELQARLSEYEIIEDDIADLSLFKEENAQLKAELERLRAEGPVAAQAVPAPAAEPELLSALVEEAQTIAASELPAADPDQNPAQAAIDALLAGAGAPEPVAAAPATEAAPDAAKVVSQEDIDKLFALAPTEPKKTTLTTEELDEEADNFVQVDLKESVAPESESESELSAKAVPEDVSKLAATADELSAIMQLSEEAPATKTDDEVDELLAAVDAAVNESATSASDANSIFESSLDTDKMLNEVAALGDGADGEDVLSGSLDTEKLLAEMTTIDGDETKAEKKPAPAAAAQTPAAPAPYIPEEEEPAGEDDLLAEFKDPTDGGHR